MYSNVSLQSNVKYNSSPSKLKQLKVMGLKLPPFNCLNRFAVGLWQTNNPKYDPIISLYSFIYFYFIYIVIYIYDYIYSHIYIYLDNARDTTNFTTICLQTDLASYVEGTTPAIKTQLSINI
jgi:hypothetical protein